MSPFSLDVHIALSFMHLRITCMSIAGIKGFILYREELKQLRSEMFEIEKSLMSQVIL